MGMNPPDLNLSQQTESYSVADRILEQSRQKGTSFAEIYWPAATFLESSEPYYTDVYSDDVREPVDPPVAKPVKSKRLSIPRENEGLIGSYSGSKHRTYDAGFDKQLQAGLNLEYGR